jgi:hypothetical protein
MTGVWRIAVRRTGPSALAMTNWCVIARTGGNVSATGTAQRRKVKKPEKKGKPEREGKAGKEERKTPALSRRRKIFSVIPG